MAKYYYNGVLLPEIPADVFASFPYAWMAKNNSTSVYEVVFAAIPWYYSSSKMMLSTKTENRQYKLDADAGVWELDSTYTDTGGYGVNNLTVIWSSHDIPNGSATATEIYFEGSTPVPEESEEPETVTQYLIRSDTLTAIADRTREMAGTNKKLTPADIIYWLGRVKFIPQGWATSEFTLDFDSGASGVLPVVVKGTASSEFTLNFESSAVGALQEG